MSDSIFIHPSAEVSEEATIGNGTRIWHQAQVMPGASIGENCNLGKGVYIDSNVSSHFLYLFKQVPKNGLPLE